MTTHSSTSSGCGPLLPGGWSDLTPPTDVPTTCPDLPSPSITALPCRYVQVIFNTKEEGRETHQIQFCALRHDPHHFNSPVTKMGLNAGGAQGDHLNLMLPPALSEAFVDAPTRESQDTKETQGDQQTLITSL